MKKAETFHYKKMKALPSDSNITNTRFYLFTDRGTYWCPPFKTEWQTFSEEMTDCFEILVVYAVRLDLDIAVRCHLDEPVDIDIGENIAFRFTVPMLSWKQLECSSRSKGNDGVCGPAGQPGSGIRFVYGQDGKLAIRGMARNSSSSDGKKRGHSVGKLLSQARPNDKTLPVRSDKDETPDPRI